MTTMKRLLLLFFFVCTLVRAQDFTQVDAVVDTYPKYRTPSTLATRIQKDFKSDANRTRAAFRWLSKNITYSLAMAQKGRRSIEFKYANEQERLQQLQAIKDQIVKEAFQNRTGVCEEFAQSLKKLCDLMDIPSEVVKGNVRNSATVINRPLATTNHAWNVVNINNRWQIMDPTWASGYAMNGRWNREFSEYYFDIPLKQVGKTHFPDSKKWQLLWNVRSKFKYYAQPIYYDRFLQRGLSFPKNISGTLATRTGGTVALDIKGLSSKDRLVVGYGNEQYSKRTTQQISDFGTQVRFPAPSRNTELYLFLNDRLAAIFKVVVN